jgi:hypothetical protein
MFSKENQPDRTNKPKGGRPKGSKDKKFLTLQYWYDQLLKDWAKLKPAQRAKLSVQLMQMLTNKLKQLPSDPQDSVFNANEALNQLKVLEAGLANKSASSPIEQRSEVLPQQNPEGL